MLFVLKSFINSLLYVKLCAHGTILDVVGAFNGVEKTTGAFVRVHGQRGKVWLTGQHKMSRWFSPATRQLEEPNSRTPPFL